MTVFVSIVKHPLFVPFQTLVTVSFDRGMLYFDDQAGDGSTPTYSWRIMKMTSPFDDGVIMTSNLNSEGQAVVGSGTLYVGAIIEDSYVICSKYNMNTGRWELIDNGTGTLNNSHVAEPSMIELDGYIYVIGGKSCKSINKYDIANNCWVDCCDLKTGVVECNLVVMDKKVLILDPKSYEVLTEHSAIIQMYDPAKNESFVVLDEAGLEKDGLENDFLRLTVQGGLCYMICYPVGDPDDSDDEVFEQNPRVFKLVCNLDSDHPSVVLGEEIPQTHPYQNNYIWAFCIEDKTFVYVHGCVHKIKDGIASEDDLIKWRNITKTYFRPVHFTYDRRELNYTRW